MKAKSLPAIPAAAVGNARPRIIHSATSKTIAPVAYGNGPKNLCRVVNQIDAVDVAHLPIQLIGSEPYPRFKLAGSKSAPT